MFGSGSTLGAVAIPGCNLGGFGAAPSRRLFVVAMAVIAAGTTASGAALGAAVTKGGGGGMASALPRVAPAQSGYTAALGALSFVRNAGQAPTGVDFVAHGASYSMSIAATQVVFSRSGTIPARTSAAAVTNGQLTMHLRGANKNAQQVTGAGAGTINYFIGSDRSKWLSGLDSYQSVGYRDVYPGIDVVYQGGVSGLEYNFSVAPGADPSAISLAFVGATSMRIDDAGDLVVSTSAGDVRQHAPVAYQQLAGVRHVVPSRFVVTGSSQVGFTLGSYDHTRPVVIDPRIVYATYLGGSGNENFIILHSQGLAVDRAGDAYVTGETCSTDFPLAHAIQTTATINCGNYQRVAFVAKFDPSGSHLLFSTYLGGTGEPFGTSQIAIDAAGNAYVGGVISVTDFPTTPGAFQTTAPAAGSWFLSKLNSAGALVYSTYVGGPDGVSDMWGLAADGSGHAYMTGSANPQFPTTLGALQRNGPGGNEAVALKMDPKGSHLEYSTFLCQDCNTGSSISQGGIAVDSAGDASVYGSAAGVNAIFLRNAIQTTDDGGANFVTKLNATGTGVIFSTYYGGPGDFGESVGGDGPRGVTTDAAGDTYITGNNFFTVQSIPIKGNVDVDGQSDQDGVNAIVAKFDRVGNLIWSRYFGAGGGELSSAIVADDQGNAYVSGISASGGFPRVRPLQGGFGGATDFFVTKFDQFGAVAFSTQLGGSDTEQQAQGLGLDPKGNLYMMGTTYSSDMPTTPGAFQATYHGGGDAYITKISLQNGTPSCPPGSQILTGTVSGPQELTPGTMWCLQNATVTGSVVVDPHTSVAVLGSTLQAGIATNDDAEVQICGSQVTGDVTVALGSGLVEIGDLADHCTPNTINGSLTVLNNIGSETDVSGNRVNGNLSCANNVPAPDLKAAVNHVQGTASGQCG